MATPISLPEDEQRQVEAFATKFMRAFARPARVEPSKWWRQVASMLTDDAVDDYLGTDPEMIPFTKITGPAELVATHDEADAFWLQPVRVPTDAGTYLLWVQLVTPGLSERLLIAEIEEP